MYFTSTRSKASQGQKPVDLSVTPGPRIETSKKFRYSTQKNYLWYACKAASADTELCHLQLLFTIVLNNSLIQSALPQFRWGRGGIHIV